MFHHRNTEPVPSSHRFLRPTVVGLTVIGLVVSGGSIATAAVGSAKPTTSALACLDAHGGLVISTKDACAKGLRLVHLPLSTVKGARGRQGVVGQHGALGATGAPGPQGSPGPVGATGLTGASGSVGSPGATGPARVVNYAYIYNLTAQTVVIEGGVTFDSNGPMFGFSHALGSTSVAVQSAGAYLVQFSLSGTQVDQFALTDNGVPVPGTTYGSGAGTQQNNGQSIASLAAGDVLTVINHSSAAAIGLATPIGGTQANVNASILIEQLG